MLLPNIKNLTRSTIGGSASGGKTYFRLLGVPDLQGESRAARDKLSACPAFRGVYPATAGTWWRIIQSMRRELAAVVSGLFLFAAFPPLEWTLTAWIALVPLLLIVVHASPV